MNMLDANADNVDAMYDHIETLWVEFLQISFGGLDYWTLSKDWKLKVFKEVAKMMMDDIRYIEEKRNEQTK